MIKNLKVFWNSVFNFINLNFLFAILTRSIVYFECLKRTTNNVIGASETNKFKCAYFIPFIFAKFSPMITPDSEPIISFSFSMFILSLTVLICFFNIIGYIFSIYLITKYDVETKFPYFKRYIKFYNSTSKFFLVIEIILAFFCLIFIVLINFFIFTSFLTI
jgi:hypothetical protein